MHSSKGRKTSFGRHYAARFITKPKMLTNEEAAVWLVADWRFFLVGCSYLAGFESCCLVLPLLLSGLVIASLVGLQSLQSCLWRQSRSQLAHEILTMGFPTDGESHVDCHEDLLFTALCLSRRLFCWPDAPDTPDSDYRQTGGVHQAQTHHHPTARYRPPSPHAQAT
jgi:hypothetical protein